MSVTLTCELWQFAVPCVRSSPPARTRGDVQGEWRRAPLFSYSDISCLEYRNARPCMYIHASQISRVRSRTDHIRASNCFLVKVGPCRSFFPLSSLPERNERFRFSSGKFRETLTARPIVFSFSFFLSLFIIIFFFLIQQRIEGKSLGGYSKMTIERHLSYNSWVKNGSIAIK